MNSRLFYAILCLIASSGLAPAETESQNIVYQVIQGHDGHADPDDNLAALAGYVAIQRNMVKYPGAVEDLGLIYGDTTKDRRAGMIAGASSGQDQKKAGADRCAHGNYLYFSQYTVPALRSLGLTNVFNVTTEKSAFNAKTPAELTSGGRFMAEKIKWAVDNSSTAKTYRVVYSAGGGHNCAAEAVSYLLNAGCSAEQLKPHFAVVQHSKWNWAAATEADARTITAPFTIRIEDQNPYSGKGKPPMTVSAKRTSAEFVVAWDVAIGNAKPNPEIPDFKSIQDCSDAGSHCFASTPSVISAAWETRNNMESPIPYTGYTITEMTADMVTEQ